MLVPADWIVAALTVFAISVVATWAVRKVAERRGWVDEPRPDRWHRAPRAKLGGVAIFIALMGGLWLFTPVTPTRLGLALLSTFLFGVGLVDDFIGLRPQTKLVAQLAAALTLFFIGFHFNAGWPFALDLFLVLFWVVGLTNAMNLLDNMDGLAAGVAIIAAVFRVLLDAGAGHTDAALQGVVLAAAVAGFLVFNFSPASIFMGDCGSFLIGFFLAAMNLTTSQTYAGSVLSVLLFPVVVLAIPIFDTAFVSVVRYFSGRPVSAGGADHLSHRLVAVGLSERRAVLILYGLSCTSGLVAYLMYRLGFSYALLAAALVLLGLLLFGVFLGSVKVYPEELVPADAPAPERVTLVTEWRYKRATLWMLVDLLTVMVAYYLAYLLRFGGTFEWERQFRLFATSVPVTAAAVLVALFARGLYRTEWRHFSLHEIRAVVAGVTIGVGVTVLLITYIFRFYGYSRAVFVLTWGAAILMLVGSRVFVRALADELRPPPRGRRVFIYGAGAAGELALTEIQMNPALDQVAVGLLDDDVFKHRTTIRGVPVLGGLDALPFLAKKHAIEAVVVSTAKIPAERLARLEGLAGRLGLEVYRVSVNMVPLERGMLATVDERRGDRLDASGPAARDTRGGRRESRSDR